MARYYMLLDRKTKYCKTLKHSKLIYKVNSILIKVSREFLMEFDKLNLK